jgi:hypothetical protein
MGYCPYWCDNCGIEQDNGWGSSNICDDCRDIINHSLANKTACMCISCADVFYLKDSNKDDGLDWEREQISRLVRKTREIFDQSKKHPEHLALLSPWISNLDIQIPTNSNNDFMEFILCKECMQKLPATNYDCSFLDDFELLSQA